MLSIKECRELILDGQDYSDQEIGDIREDLYTLGELALDDYFRNGRKKGSLKGNQ